MELRSALLRSQRDQVVEQPPADAPTDEVDGDEEVAHAPVSGVFVDAGLLVARLGGVVEPAQAAGGDDAAGILGDEDLFAPELLDQGLGRGVLAAARDELGRVLVHEHAVVAA